MYKYLSLFFIVTSIWFPQAISKTFEADKGKILSLNKREFLILRYKLFEKKLILNILDVEATKKDLVLIDFCEKVFIERGYNEQEAENYLTPKDVKYESIKLSDTKMKKIESIIIKLLEKDNLSDLQRDKLYENVLKYISADGDILNLIELPNIKPCIIF